MYPLQLCNTCDLTSYASRSGRRTNPNNSDPFHTIPNLENFFPVKIPSSTGLMRYHLQLIAPTYAKLRNKIFARPDLCPDSLSPTVLPPIPQTRPELSSCILPD